MSKSGFVAIVGRPNAGKSTLLNSVLGMELSIVTPKAQTTRDKVLGILTEPQGQIVFVDTPGIHKADIGGINERMVGVASEALDGPSVAWYLVDPKTELKHEQTVLEMLKKSGAPVFLILNKTDTLRGAVNRTRGDALLQQIREACEAQGIAVEQTFLISALEKEGLKKLLALTWERIEEGPRYFEDEDQVSDRPTKFFVAEMIREQLMLRLGEEVPYSCGVEINRFDEKTKPVRIEATIFVERESQKGIVVGKGGAKIKEIGQNARAKIETFLGHQVFLGLQVKLLKDWTKDKEALKRMGYEEPRKQRIRDSKT